MAGCDVRTTSLMLACFGLLWATAAAASATDGGSHPCRRECGDDEPAMTCEYHFTVEWFRTLNKACWDCPFNITDCFRPHCVTGDGKSRLIMTFNREIPGPAIEVCEGDMVVVMVKNKAEDGSTTSVHWHGMHLPGTPYMDGAPHVTQCPILPMEVFRYQFTATPAGTYFYHSHTGVQIGDGLYGALIVRQSPAADVNLALYDRDLSEHVVQIGDWVPVPAMDRAVELMDEYSVFLLWSAVINGRGRLHPVPNTHNTSGSPLSSAPTPLTTFRVSNGTRYRFRLINVGQKCPFRVFFDRHPMLIIASDGQPVSPVTVDSLLFGPGERYDVVISADQPVGSYWVRAIGLRDCAFTKGTTAAILKYDGATEEEPSGDFRDGYTPGSMFGPMRGMRGQVYLGDGHPTVLLTDLNSTAPQPVSLSDRPPDVTHYLGVDFVDNDDTNYNHPVYYPAHSIRPHNRQMSSTINYITFLLPSVPLLTQPEDVDMTSMCNSDTIANLTRCHNSVCQCTHRISVPLGQVVELVVAVVSNLGAGHVMHLHGHKFQVLAMEPYGPPYAMEHLQQLDQLTPLNRTQAGHPPLKDTVNIPNYHYAILRFKADNPGVWPFHCHVSTHMLVGQAMVIQVGEVSQWPPVPPNFPRCGGYGVAYPRAERTEAEPCTGSASSVPRCAANFAAILFSVMCVFG